MTESGSAGENGGGLGAAGCGKLGAWQGASTHSVIPGLEPGIHAPSAVSAVGTGNGRGAVREHKDAGCCVWIPGSSPGMTEYEVGLGLEPQCRRPDDGDWGEARAGTAKPSVGRMTESGSAGENGGGLGAAGCGEVGAWQGASTHSVIPLEPGIHAASAVLAVGTANGRGSLSVNVCMSSAACGSQGQALG
ncbi:hypothetical protein CO648_05150 [Rhizobium phaseoli]|nr:hypothetical protein CO648_05150 [Rhizobium phaseoli]